MGYGGYANLIQADDTLVMYSYCCYNVNNDGYKRFMQTADGELYIDRDAFPEPEIHTKFKRTGKGKKRPVVKRVKKEVPFDDLLQAGKIKVKNASGTWAVSDFGTDVMALRLLCRLFDQYQETGELPESVGSYQ